MFLHKKKLIFTFTSPDDFNIDSEKSLTILLSLSNQVLFQVLFLTNDYYLGEMILYHFGIRCQVIESWCANLPNSKYCSFFEFGLPYFPTNEYYMIENTHDDMEKN